MINMIQANSIIGFQYISDYITQYHHNLLIQQIDTQPWLTDLKRRVQHYGYKYDYKAKAINQSLHLGDLPDWLLNLAQRLHYDNLISELPDQVIVNEYLPGQGISPHIDCVPCFTDTIISLSLGSPCVMEFKNTNTIPVLLEPRSLVVLKDDARYKWTHSIPARKIDKFPKAGLSGQANEQRITRERRISLTFRKVILT
jgi:Alkylated DNA repair protein